MDFIFERLQKTLDKIENNLRIATVPITDAKWSFCDYKTGHKPDDDAEWIPIEKTAGIKGECHGWISAKLTVPAEWKGKTIFFFDHIIDFEIAIFTITDDMVPDI